MRCVWGWMIVGMLGSSAVSAGPLPYEPHLHGSTAVHGAKLINLVKKRGNLRAGLDALGLGHLSDADGLKAAKLLMDLSQPNHSDAYARTKLFRRAAFSGKAYAHWVRRTAELVRSEAHTTFMQLSHAEIEQFIETAHRHRISLSGIGILADITRLAIKPEFIAKLLADHEEVMGIDVVGSETMKQSREVLVGAVDVLARSGRKGLVLRVHAGEGFLGEQGHENVNIVLSTLVERSAKGDMKGLRVILGHAARISNLDGAARDIALLRSRGIKVEVNPNPLSNLVYHAVDRLDDIAALKLPGETMIPGSDNVGTLAMGKDVTEALVAGDSEKAEHIVRHLRHLTQRWQKTQQAEKKP